MANVWRQGACPRAAVISRALWSRQELCLVGTATGASAGAHDGFGPFPMISEWELRACANHYIREHGEDAAPVAAMRADELLAEGDPNSDRLANARVDIGTINHIKMGTSPMVAIVGIVSE